MHTQTTWSASINLTTLTSSMSSFLHNFFVRLTVLSCRLICGSTHRTLGCSLARGTTEMECMTHTHTSIHSFFSPCIPLRGTGQFDSAKLYFHITQSGVHYGRQLQTCYIKTEEGNKKTQKATLVSSYLDASTSNAGSDKVTASKSSKNLRAIHLSIQPGRSTRRNKGGSSRAGKKHTQKEERGGGEWEKRNVK